MNLSEKEIWFNNINKSDNGIDINIIPSENNEKIEIQSSSKYENMNIQNVTDENPYTKWVSNYNKMNVNNGFFMGKEITYGDYSRGILQEGNNENIYNEYKKKNKTNINLLRKRLSNEINKLKSEKYDIIMNKQDTDFKKETYIHIGNSRSNIKDINISKDAIQPVKSTISNRYGDIFNISIYESNGNKYLRTKRTDASKGWGDTAVGSYIYVIDQDAWNEYKLKRDTNNKKENQIRDTTAKINREINLLNSKIDNKQNYVNNLSVNVKNDGKYIGNKKTMLTNGSMVNGEWIQVIIPNTLTVKEYKLLPGRKNNKNELTPFPKDFYLLGSNNSDKWDIIDNHFDYNPVYFDINTPITFSINNKKQYNYVRLVISSLNSANMDYEGLGSVSLSIFNLLGNQYYTLNKSTETFQLYSNKAEMSKVEGLTIMEENINVLTDLKDFTEKYHKYIQDCDIITTDIETLCTEKKTALDTAYTKLYNNNNDGSIQDLQNAPLNVFSTKDEYGKKCAEIRKKHSEIIPLRKELDSKLNQLTDDKNSINADYKKQYDITMYSSLVLSVILTSSLFFIFKKL